MNLSQSVSTLQTLLSNLNPGDAKFAAGLVAAYKKYGNLTPKQAPWVEKLIERAQPKVAAPVFSPSLVQPVVETVNVGGFEGVVALFNAAKSHLKFPKISLLVAGNKTVKLVLLGAKSKYAGSVSITNGGKYPQAIWYGRVSPEGVFTPSAKLVPEFLTALTALLQEFSQNPARVAKEHGKLTGHCCFCNKELGLGEDKRSVVVGFGPVCADHYGLKAEWLSGVAKAEAKASVEVAEPVAEVAPFTSIEQLETVLLEGLNQEAAELVQVDATAIEANITAIATAEPESVVEAKTCFFCEASSTETKELHGYVVCANCIKELAFVQGESA